MDFSVNASFPSSIYVNQKEKKKNFLPLVVYFTEIYTDDHRLLRIFSKSNEKRDF